jgi:sugar phosphate isomerase/epimerase
MYHIGFVSAIFAHKSFEQVIDFAAANGFACVELMCWPKGLAERRYAGVTHIDVDTLNTEKIAHIQQYLKQKNIYISGLGYYPNPLDADEEKSNFYITHIKKVITAAALLGVPIVNTFIGRNQFKSLPDNLLLYSQKWPNIIAHATANKIKIAIENCPMYFTQDEWPGGKNLAISPAIWKEMYNIIPSENFGLNFDPSHFIWQQLDYLQVLHNFKHKLFHIHLKDTKLFKDKLAKVGTMATPLEYQMPKLPGLGDVDWKAFLQTLQQVNYTGPLVIEFEDKDYESSEEKIIEGLLQTKKYIQNLGF